MPNSLFQRFSPVSFDGLLAWHRFVLGARQPGGTQGYPLGFQRDYHTPKRLKGTYSTTKITTVIVSTLRGLSIKHGSHAKTCLQDASSFTETPAGPNTLNVDRRLSGPKTEPLQRFRFLGFRVKGLGFWGFGLGV